MKSKKESPEKQEQTEQISNKKIGSIETSKSDQQESISDMVSSQSEKKTPRQKNDEKNRESKSDYQSGFKTKSEEPILDNKKQKAKKRTVFSSSLKIIFLFVLVVLGGVIGGMVSTLYFTHQTQFFSALFSSGIPARNLKQIKENSQNIQTLLSDQNKKETEVLKDQISELKKESLTKNNQLKSQIEHLSFRLDETQNEKKETIKTPISGEYTSQQLANENSDISSIKEYLSPYLETVSNLTDRITQIEKKVQIVGKDLGSNLETYLKNNTLDTESIKGLKTEQEKLKTDLKKLSIQIENMIQDMVLFKQKSLNIETIQKIAQLQKQIVKGEPYSQNLSGVEPALEQILSRQELNALNYFAENGLPSLVQLKQDFPYSSLKQAFPAKKSIFRSWIDRLIKVKKTDPYLLTDQKKINEINRLVEQGKFEDSLKLSESLSENTQQILSDWRNRLKKYIDANKALLNLNTYDGFVSPNLGGGLEDSTKKP